MTVDWYMKDKAENVSEDESYIRTDWIVPVMFYDGSKWRQDTAYLKDHQYKELEKAGKKHGHDVWRLN